MGKWLRKVGKFADNVVDKVEDRLDDIDWDLDIGDNFKALTGSIRQCAQHAKDTIQIVDDTLDKRDKMIAFGTEIQSTLRGLSDGTSDASILETIRELTAGDKIEAAMEIAKGLDVVALSCADKSVQMIDAMESGLDSLPDMLQHAIEKRADDHEQAGGPAVVQARELIDGLDSDLNDVQSCIRDIQHLNLSTALKVGMQAFTHLTNKAVRSKSMFDSVRTFAVDVQEVVDAVHDKKPREIIKQSKDLLRCIGLSDLIRLVAEGARKLIVVMIDLFKATADRISKLWSALAYAKDCMMDCVQYVNDAKTLILDTKDKSVRLITKSRSVKDQLEDVGDFNKESIRAIKSLTHGSDMKEAIELATNMDDLVIECTKKVVAMINRVDEGFRNLPEILTEGLDPTNVGTADDVQKTRSADVESDINELDESRDAILKSDIISAGKAGIRGFNGVADKAGVCGDILGQVDRFAGNCDSTIVSFMSTWDLESAGKKITEMLQLFNLSKLMKEFADQVKRLIVSIIALIQAAIDKFTKGFVEFGEKLDKIGDKIGDSVDDAKDMLKDKLQFWK